MKFTATYTDDVMGFEADDWADAVEQAMGHEGGREGDLLGIEWDQTEAEAAIAHWEATIRRP